MKISIINQFTRTNFPQRSPIKKALSQEFRGDKNLWEFPLPSSCIYPKNNDENAEYKSFISKRGKTNIKQCQDIIDNHKGVLSRAYGLCSTFDDIKTTPDKMAKIAIALKNYYDDLYENYTIVSTGTSPASIAEIMQNIGCKTIFLPITELRFFSENKLHPMRTQYPTIASRHPNVNILMKYATKKGIAKKEAGELLIVDFCHSGKSLDTMIRILNERGDLKPEKIHGCSIIKDLEEAIKKDTSMGLDETDIQNLYRDLISSSLEKVTNVPHFTYNDVEHYGNQIYSYDRKPHEIFCAFDDFSLQAARAWALCTTNEALKLLQK